MPYVESELGLSVRNSLEFPLMFNSSLEKSIAFIADSINLDASVSEESRISFDLGDWRIVKEIISTQTFSSSDRGSAELKWNIEAVIRHPSEMSADEILQEIQWLVIPNTVWDDEIEVTAIESTLV